MTATASSTAGADRLRTRLRSELPPRLAAHTGTATALPNGERRELGQRLAGEIARAHTEAELMG